VDQDRAEARLNLPTWSLQAGCLDRGQARQSFADEGQLRVDACIPADEHVAVGVLSDPDSQVDNSPTLFATDRTDRRTYFAQGWKVTDPQVLADVGPVPDHEAIIEIPEDVLKFYVRAYQEQEGDH
jgi:hypothetical protein